MLMEDKIKYIFETDPYLEPYKEKILARHERIEAARAKIAAGGKLSDGLNNYLYYGLHRDLCRFCFIYFIIFRCICQLYFSLNKSEGNCAYLPKTNRASVICRSRKVISAYLMQRQSSGREEQTQS